MSEESETKEEDEEEEEVAIKTAKEERDEEAESNEPEETKDKVERNMEQDVIRLNEERWPNVNGVYDAQGEWHDWNDLTYSFSYDNSELIILPYTVCIISLPGQQFVTDSSRN